jgi:hypothetical protein
MYVTNGKLLMGPFFTLHTLDPFFFGRDFEKGSKHTKQRNSSSSKWIVDIFLFLGTFWKIVFGWCIYFVFLFFVGLISLINFSCSI